MRTMKMKTKLRSSEAKVMTVECILIVALLTLCFFGLVQILHGSLLAVVYTSASAMVASLIGEDACRIYEEAKRRDGNG